MNTFTVEQIAEFRAKLNAAFDARAAHELSKNAANDSIQDCIKTMRKALDHDAIVSVMLASNVDADFINRAERSNARYNVYAAEKVVNIARVLAKVPTQLNHYTKAILDTAAALEASERILTHRDAVCACSKQVKHTDSKREALIKTTRYQKEISANTASTQSSSSLNALATFNAVSESRDAANNVTYTLNRDSAVAALISQ